MGQKLSRRGVKNMDLGEGKAVSNKEVNSSVNWKTGKGLSVSMSSCA